MQTGSEPAVNWALIIFVFVGLFIFGLFYNWFVSWLNRRHYSDGYTALLVVFGTLMTLFLLAPIIGITNALLCLAGFAASGFPMVVGDVWRAVRKRESSINAMRDEATK